MRLKDSRFLRWLTVERLMVAILFLAIFGLATRPAVDTDMWWHLATGRYILTERTIPHHDVFSYTVPDHRWFTHEWLTQVLMYGLYLLGGKTALILATALTVTASFALVYILCENRPYVAAFVTLVGVVSTAIVWGPRPQLVNVLMMALFLLLIERYRRGDRRALWSLPLLTILWVNMHSGFFLGLGLLGVVLAGEGLAILLKRTSPRTLSPTRWRGLVLVLLLCILAALLNPNGYHMLLYPFDTLGSSAMQTYIQEWASPNFHRFEFWPFGLLLLGGAAILILSRRRVDTTDLLLFLGFGFAGLLSARHIPLFAVAAVPIVTRALGDVTITSSSPARHTAPFLLNWLLLLLFIVMTGLWSADVLQEADQTEVERYPVAALEYIEQHDLDEQRIYNSYNWGGYLIWKGYPVFIDGRADVYGDDFMLEYVMAFHLQGDWRVPLDKYDVDYILIEDGISLNLVLEEAPEWNCVYRDDMASIFVRDSTDG